MRILQYNGTRFLPISPSALQTAIDGNRAPPVTGENTYF